MTNPINMTEQAAGQIRSLLKAAPEGTQGVRLNVKPSGCSGNSYRMEYIGVEESVAGDDVFEQDGAKIFIPKTHSWMLFGTLVDYVKDDLGNQKFEFKNPNEEGRCGCGESFYVDADKLKKPE